MLMFFPAPVFFQAGAFAALLLFLVLLRVRPSGVDRLVDFAGSKTFQVSVAFIALAGFTIIVLYSTFYPGLLDHVEPNIASVSWLIGKGFPLYNGINSVQRYSLVYGPLAYLPFTWGMAILGGSILSLKIVVLAAVLGIVCFSWHSYRQLLDRPKSAIAVLVVVGFLMGGSLPYLLEVRGDVLIILCAAWALGAAVSPNALLAVAFSALACAAGVDIKVTGLLYFLPMFVLLGYRHGWKRAGVSLIAAGVLSFVPFLIPGVSLPGYLLWIRAASKQPLGTDIPNILEYVLKFSLPILLLAWRFASIDVSAFWAYLRERRLFLGTLAGCFGAMTVLCSKAGAGVHHLLPFCPVLGYLCADLYTAANAHRKAAAHIQRSFPQFACWLAIGAFFGMRLAGKLQTDLSIVVGERAHAQALVQDVDSIMKSHPHERIEMGYGETDVTPPMPDYALTYVRPALVFAGNPLTMDAAALADMQLSGIQIPEADIDYISSCQTRVWLIPKGEPAFSQVNVYSFYGPRVMPRRNLFSESLRRAFLAHDRKVGSSKFFDIWSCVQPAR